MGKTIRVNDELTVVVNGVLKDIRHSVIPNEDIMCRIDNIRAVGQNMFDDYNSAGSVNVFVMKREGADLASKSDDIRNWFKTFFWIYERDLSTVVEFVPLKQLYFWNHTYSPGIERGNRQFVIILLSVGLLILLFAIINYINLTVAQTGFRGKGDGYPAVVGVFTQRIVFEADYRVDFADSYFFLYRFVPGFPLCSLCRRSGTKNRFIRLK